MQWPHALFAILSAFRLTTLFSTDAIWDWPRRKLPLIPWHCALCMSVWGGILATAFLIAIPWANWPLGMSWLYLAMKRGLRMETSELEARVNAMHAEYQLHIGALTRRATELSAELTSGALREKALHEENENLKKELEAAKKSAI